MVTDPEVTEYLEKLGDAVLDAASGDPLRAYTVTVSLAHAFGLCIGKTDFRIVQDMRLLEPQSRELKATFSETIKRKMN